MYELSLLCPEAHVEDLSEALEALDALSVSVEDADAQTEHEQALFGEPGMPLPKDGWQRSKVIALFAKEVQAKEAAVLLAAQDFFESCQLLSIAALPDQDWVRLTQSQFALSKSHRSFGLSRLGMSPPQRHVKSFDWILVWPLVRAPIPPHACASSGLPPIQSKVNAF